MSATIKPTAAPSTFGGFDKFGAGCCPTTGFTGGNFPGAQGEWSGFPSTFGGNFGGFPSTFSGYGSNWPSTFGGNFGGFPSSFGGFGGFPSTFGGYNNWPSTFSGYGSNWPLTFGGNFGGNSTFGGFPWGTESSWATPYSRWGSTGFPSSWSFNDWTNFEKTFFNDFDRSMKTVERELDTLRRIFDFSSKATGKDTTGKSYSTSMVQLPSRPTSSLEYYTFQNPVRYDAEGNRWLCLAFDLPSFKPEEIKVTLYSKANPAYIEVIATHDVKDAKEHAVKRTYERKYFFPADLYLKAEEIAKLELKSHFSNDGCLYVECKLPQLTAELAAKEKTHYPTWSMPVKTEKKDL